MIEVKHTENPWKNFKSDLPAGLVVFLVAMPLCLGIAMASGAPLFGGLIAGAVGGIVVGVFSGSPLGVSGPAAGLAVIVINGIETLGSYESFLLAVAISGVIQLIFGFARAGIVAYYFPSSVINGMLSGIGILIFLKQIPHAFGYDADPEGDLSFNQVDQHNTLSELYYMLDGISLGPTIITIVGLGILILWETRWIKKFAWSRIIQGPLIVVGLGIILNSIFSQFPSLVLRPEQLVQIPMASSFPEFLTFFTFPDFSQITNPQVYFTAFIIAAVGSIEGLLCAEASDKQDPQRRTTPANRELKAQGMGNLVSGLVGGLPLTQVIVRSSVNVQAGGKTKAACVFHGILICISVFFIPGLLNHIPLAALAAILLVVGYKLAKPATFIKMKKRGLSQFLPFISTILVMLFTDLLTGIGFGLVVSIFFILYRNIKIPIAMENELEDENHKHIVLELTEDISFLQKASVLRILAEIPDDREVTIDASKTNYIHPDVIDIIEDFQISAESRNINVHLVEIYDHKQEDPMTHFKIK